MADRRLEMVNENFVSTTPTSTTVWFYFRWKKCPSRGQSTRHRRPSNSFHSHSSIHCCHHHREKPEKKRLNVGMALHTFRARSHTSRATFVMMRCLHRSKRREESNLSHDYLSRGSRKCGNTSSLIRRWTRRFTMCIFSFCEDFTSQRVELFFFFFLEKSQLNFWPSPALTSQTVFQPRFSRQRQRFRS